MKKPKPSKFPKTLFVTIDGVGEDECRFTYDIASDAVECADDGGQVAVYTLSYVGRASVKREIVK